MFHLILVSIPIKRAWRQTINVKLHASLSLALDPDLLYPNAEPLVLTHDPCVHPVDNPAVRLHGAREGGDCAEVPGAADARGGGHPRRFHGAHRRRDAGADHRVRQVGVYYLSLRAYGPWVYRALGMAAAYAWTSFVRSLRREIHGVYASLFG